MSVHENTLSRDYRNHGNAERTRGILPNFKRLLSARKSLGLTQEQVAVLADVDVKTVRKSESNTRLDVATLGRIAAALGLELCEVLAESTAAVRTSCRSTVRRWQFAWLRRDMQRLLLCYHADAVVVLPGEPFMPFSGRHQGHVAIASVCNVAWSFLTSLPGRGCDQLVIDSPLAVALQCFSQFASSKGHLFQLNCTHIFQFEKLQIVKHYIDYDTLLMSRVLFETQTTASHFSLHPSTRSM